MNSRPLKVCPGSVRTLRLLGTPSFICAYHSQHLNQTDNHGTLYVPLVFFTFMFLLLLFPLLEYSFPICQNLTCSLRCYCSNGPQVLKGSMICFLPTLGTLLSCTYFLHSSLVIVLEVLLSPLTL